VFSGLNNLSDISMDRRYADMVGYTQEELETNFPDRLEELAEAQGLSRSACLARIREWYDGYRFTARDVRVYNPFSTLVLFERKEFKNYWFETGTPTFLLKLIKERQFEVWDPRERTIGENGFASYDIERLQLLPLLVQTGYLTIADYDAQQDLYTLDYPNREVRNAFTEYLAAEFSGVPPGEAEGLAARLVRALKAGELAQVMEVVSAFVANLPYDISVPNEKYYQTVFYLLFLLVGARVSAEVRTNKGRVDAVVELEKDVWVFEFKMDGDADGALAQIREKGYADKYRAAGKTVHCVGVGFDQARREIGRWVVGKQ